MSTLTISLSGLRAIEALAAHGSVTAAAAALGYTPSAVSQQISRLERDLREPLVERIGRRMTVTVAGRIIAGAASRVLIELEGAAAELQAQTGRITGELRIAAFPTAARGIVPPAMAALLEASPEVELRVIEADSHTAVDLVAGGSVDLAVAHDWQVMPLEVPDGLQVRQLGQDVSDVLVHERHPLAGVAVVDLEGLHAQEWMYEPASVAHDLLLHAFRAQPYPLSRGHVIGEYATQIRMVASGLGIALVPRMGRGALPDTVRVLALRDAPVRRIYGVWRPSVARRPVVRAALDCLESAFRDGSS